MRRHAGSVILDACDHPVDDGDIIVGVAPYQSEKLVRKNIVLREEGSVAAATIHETRGEFSAQLGAGFEEKTRKPRNAADGC